MLAGEIGFWPAKMLKIDSILGHFTLGLTFHFTKFIILSYRSWNWHFSCAKSAEKQVQIGTQVLTANTKMFRCFPSPSKSLVVGIPVQRRLDAKFNWFRFACEKCIATIHYQLNTSVNLFDINNCGNDDNNNYYYFKHFNAKGFNYSQMMWKSTANDLITTTPANVMYFKVALVAT